MISTLPFSSLWVFTRQFLYSMGSLSSSSHLFFFFISFTADFNSTSNLTLLAGPSVHSLPSVLPHKLFSSLSALVFPASLVELPGTADAPSYPTVSYPHTTVPSFQRSSKIQASRGISHHSTPTHLHASNLHLTTRPTLKPSSQRP